MYRIRIMKKQRQKRQNREEREEGKIQDLKWKDGEYRSLKFLHI